MGVGAAMVGAAAIGAIGSKQSADASKSAARTQAQATSEATAERRRQFDQTRSDLAPFMEAGTDALPGLVSLSTDPEAQRDFVTENPFFNALAEESQDRIFSNQAAKGKLGSGETAEALQNSLLLLGSDLLNQGISRRQNIVGMGQNAAAQTGTFGAQASRDISDLTTQRGNALAAGEVGAANAQARGINNAMGSITSLYAIDRMS